MKISSRLSPPNASSTPKTVPADQMFGKAAGESAPPESFPATVSDVYYSPSGQERRLSEVLLERRDQYAEVLARAVEAGELSPEEALEKQEAFNAGKLGPYRRPTNTTKAPSATNTTNAAGATTAPNSPTLTNAAHAPNTTNAPNSPTTTDATNASTPPSALNALNSPGAANSPYATLLRDLENEQFCLTRHPQQAGDGLYRPMDFYVSPGHLTLKAVAQGWETAPDSTGQPVPVADAVVIGAGPGGLTSAWQLARRGARVVCFESELAGAAFSDAGAKPVHHMRTSVDLTNLVRDGHSHAMLEHPLSLSGGIEERRPHARAGREGFERLTGQRIEGVPAESLTNDRNSPATRGELYDHLSSLAYSLAHDFDDAVLCERSPVEQVQFEDGLFTVTTSRGHTVKAKELVLATGLTGPQGERARSLKVLDDAVDASPDRALMLGHASDTQARAEELEQVASGQSARALVVNDRLLGDQAVRQTVASFPEGSRVAMVGSGESAIKGALELAHLNPQLQVDLFVKEKLEAAQVQVPAENFHQAVIEGSLGHPERSAAAFDTYRFFGTPVTPRSLREIFELQQQGRVRLLELDAYFDEQSMQVQSTDRGTLSVAVVDPKVQASLDRGHGEAVSKGLAPNESSPFRGDEYRAVVVGVGYRPLKLEDHPLAHLPPEAQAHLHVNTVANAHHPAQSALPGLATQGRRLAETIAERTVDPERRVEIEVPQEYGVDWRTQDDEVVDGIIAHRGVHPNFAQAVERAVRRDGSHPQQIQLLLTESDTYARELAARPPESLTPAEAEVLDRSLTLAHRLHERAADQRGV